MKTVTIFSVLLFFSVLLAGCIQEEIAPNAGTGRVLTVNYSFDTPQTRTATTGAEREVRDVAVFFYNADDTHPENETYIACQSVTVPSGGGTSGSFPLPLPVEIQQGVKYKLIVIGNYQKYAPEGKSLAAYADNYSTRTYSKMKQEIQGQLADDAARVTNPLPFWGRLLGKDGNETTLTGPSPTDTNLGVSVKFSRAVARFDVMNLAAGQLKIAWVKVCNFRNKGYFFHESAFTGEIVRGTAAEAPQAGNLPPGYVPAPPPSGSPGALRQNLNAGGLYAFPNIVSYTAQDDKLTTFLMIAGYYQPPGGPANNDKLTYYRANVSTNGEGQFLRRNYAYMLTIGNVKKEGADTEEGAVNEKEKLLDYVVDDSWESESGSTVTDNAGNFLTLSRTSVVLGSDAGASEVIKVSVKKGTGWKPTWKNNEGEAFRIETVNDESFSIVTNGENHELFTRNAALTVSVTEITSTVTLTVNVIQLSSVNDPRMLTVEGRTGNFEYTVPGQGGLISLQVITGSSASSWKAVPDNDLKGCINSFNGEGANNGSVDLVFAANTGGERGGTITVKRYLADGSLDESVDPVKVTFVQGTSPYKVTLVPNYISGLEIDGFSAETGNVNGVSTTRRFNVLLADPVRYTFKATSTFNKNSDAFLTVGNEDFTPQAGPLQSSKTAPEFQSSVTGVSGQNIYLNIFRTGPGDKNIKGTLIVTAMPKPEYPGLLPFTVRTSIVIKSGCQIGDARIGNLLWADRNIGAVARNGGALIGLNYSNDPNSDDNQPNNFSFKGEYANWDRAKTKCTDFGVQNGYEGELSTGWRVPNSTEMADRLSKANVFIFSKQRAFILSDDKTEGNVGCWFPLSGKVNNSQEAIGYYWSSTANNTGQCYLKVGPDFTQFLDVGETKNELTVRCVRDIPPAPPAR